MKKIIYCFWTGNNEMSFHRKRCFDTMYKSNCEIQLVTNENLHLYVKPEYPLHKAFNCLSLTHKSDYLRCYFMHHHGGGYSDVKEITSSWGQAFEDLINSEHYINGYPEIGPEGVAPVDEPLYSILKQQYKNLIGCGSFICKPYSPFTTEWINVLHKKLDFYQAHLNRCPALHPQEKPGMIINGARSQYPIKWTEIMGNIFHPLCLKYSSYIKQTVPPCIFKNYR